MSLTQVARKHAISRASVCRMIKESNSYPAAGTNTRELPYQAGA
jgi:hypothetical protein